MSSTVPCSSEPTLRPRGRKSRPAAERICTAVRARYRRAADFARRSFFNDRAIRLYSQALICLGDADLAARIHLWHDLGSVYELKGDHEAALGGEPERHLAEARQACDRAERLDLKGTCRREVARTKARLLELERSAAAGKPPGAPPAHEAAQPELVF